MKVLYIAASAPYDKVGHAGGQTLNYYIKKMAKNEKNQVAIAAYCAPDDLNKIDVESYGIRFFPILKKGGISDFVGNVFSIPSKINPWHRFGNIMTRHASRLLLNGLRKIRNSGYVPDVIIMEWTQIVIQATYIKRIFPLALLVASEHDVTYLGIQRLVELETNKVHKYYVRVRAKNIKKREISALQVCDLVFTHNIKDDKLLEDAEIPSEKRKVMVPFYHQSVMQRKRNNNDIIFYGNMKRKENYLAAFWFIDHVMPLVKELPVRFVVLGGGPTVELRKKECEKVHITGFVDDIDPYFAKSMCFVAPLELGAGIKVKVIEAMYTGIPVLTNDVGIEGIPADSRKDFYYCKTPDDYATVIRKLLKNESSEMKTNGKRFIKSQFSLQDSYENYYQVIFNRYNMRTKQKK